MKRYFIRFSYNGTAYSGWQIQPNGLSVQEVLQKALSTLLRQDVSLVAAGRTDAGVHASEMYAHFDWSDLLPDVLLIVDKLNKFLPKDIAVFDIRQVHPDAHARFDALCRRYQYKIHRLKSPFLDHLSCRFGFDLDFDRMNSAAQILFEFEDFTSFSKLHTDVKTNLCTIYHARWEKLNDNEWVFTISANRFLRNMVRAIVGTLLEVGRGKVSLEQFREIIVSKNRSNAGVSVPACGLYLVEVEYPQWVWDVEGK